MTHEELADIYAANAVAMVNDIEAKRAFELACFEALVEAARLKQSRPAGAPTSSAPPRPRLQP